MDTNIEVCGKYTKLYSWVYNIYSLLFQACGVFSSYATVYSIYATVYKVTPVSKNLTLIVTPSR